LKGGEFLPFKISLSLKKFTTFQDFKNVKKILKGGEFLFSPPSTFLCLKKRKFTTFQDFKNVKRIFIFTTFQNFSKS